ncbi:MULTISPECIES: hypothetical protein [unclassified Bosea (in: a-proteobacteria)]|uniref:hypothetical protein n=1 Tax=unclassified Bosea (in: a-proteobacteria) TaxID=2653178 RepID=UPI000F7E6FC3|nr:MULTISPECIES: hypothetical protein [unclassified Bosea (in: a-proteobacteria)]
MTEAAFEIRLDYSAEEFAQYQTIDAGRRQALVKPSPLESWPALISLGCAVALLAAGLAVAGGASDLRAGGTIAALVFAAFWLGLWAPSLAARASAADREQAAFDDFMAEWRDCRVLVTQAGLWTRSHAMRGFMPFSAIRSATVAHGLLSLWPEAGAPISLPLRLLNPDQQARLVALAGRTEKAIAPSGSA